MNKPIRILGIAGSLRKASFNQGVLRAAAELAPEGATIEIFDLDGIPGFNQDDEQDPPEKVAESQTEDTRVRCDLVRHPGIQLFHSRSIEKRDRLGLTSLRDSAWDGKPAAIMGASIGGIATARAQYHLRQMMVFLNMFPVNQPEVMIGNCSDKFDDQGNLTDDETKNFIRQLLENLVDWTYRLGDRKEMRKTQ